MRELPKPLDQLSVWSAIPPKLDFVLPGLITGTVGALVSPGGTGKSMFGLELAIGIAGGPDFMRLGFAESGKVLYLAAEDPEPVISTRLHALGQFISSETKAEVAANLDVIPAVSAGVDFAAQGDEWVGKLSQAAMGYRLIVIDTLSRVHSGDENDRQSAAHVMRHLEKLAVTSNAAVLYLHHTSKSAAQNGQGASQQAARGSSVWVDESRWTAFLRGMDEREAKQAGVSETDRANYVRYGVSKNNYGPPEPDKWLMRHTNGVLVPALFKHKAPKGKPHSRGDDDW